MVIEKAGQGLVGADGMDGRNITPLPTPAFRSYFEIFSGHGEVDAQSLENILLLVGISVTPAQVEDALSSADIDGELGGGFILNPRQGQVHGQHETCAVTQGSALTGS